MGDLNNFRPSLTKDGDYSGYIKPSEYRKQITTPMQSEFPSQQGDWNFYESGFGRTYTMTEKVSDQVYPWETTQFLVPKDNFVTASTGVMSFDVDTSILATNASITTQFALKANDADVTLAFLGVV